MFLDNKYSIWYNELMQSRKLLHRPGIYTERHHIKPTALGGHNVKENIIHLTGREHFLAQ